MPAARSVASLGRLGAGVCALVVSACSSSVAPHSSAAVDPAVHPSSSVSIVLTDSGCAPQPPVSPPGVVTFTVTDHNARAVSEVDVDRADGLILGVQSNLTPGERSTITMRLGSGSYTVACPGATVAQNQFSVLSGKDWRSNAVLVAAQHAYVAWLQAEAQPLLSATAKLARAVAGGDTGSGRSAYLAARVIDEQVRTVLEGPVDTRLNGVLNDFPSAAQFVGFHRLEQALWQGGGSLSAVDSVAGSLVGDMQQAADALKAATPTPAQIGNAATALMVRATTLALSGELERYSGLGLAMAQAELDGAQHAYAALRPALQGIAPVQAQTVDARLAAAAAALLPFKRAPGDDGSGFVSTAALSDSQRHSLVRAFNALSAAFSQLSGYLQ